MTKGGRPWGPIRARSAEGADLAQALRDLINGARGRPSLEQLGKELGYSRARLGEFCSGSATPSWEVVAELVRATVPERERPAQLRLAKRKWEAAQDAPDSSGPVKPSLPTEPRVSEPAGHQLIAALTTVAELERAKAKAEKLAMWLRFVNSGLKQELRRLENERSGWRTTQEPDGDQALTLDQRRSKVQLLRLRTERDLRSASEEVETAGMLLRKATRLRERLQSQVAELSDRGVLVPGIDLSEVGADGPEPSDPEHLELDLHDLEHVSERSGEILEETRQDLEKLRDSVVRQTAALDSTAPKGPDKPVTGPEPSDNPRKTGPRLWTTALMAGAALLVAAAYALPGGGNDRARPDLRGYQAPEDLCAVLDSPSFLHEYPKKDSDPQHHKLDKSAIESSSCYISLKRTESAYADAYLSVSIELHKQTDPAPEFRAKWDGYDEVYEDYHVEKVSGFGDEAYLVTMDTTDGPDTGSRAATLAVRDGWTTYEMSWSLYLSTSDKGKDSLPVREAVTCITKDTTATLSTLRSPASHTPLPWSTRH